MNTPRALDLTPPLQAEAALRPVFQQHATGWPKTALLCFLKRHCGPACDGLQLADLAETTKSHNVFRSRVNTKRFEFGLRVDDLEPRQYWVSWQPLWMCFNSVSSTTVTTVKRVDTCIQVQNHVKANHLQVALR